MTADKLRKDMHLTGFVWHEIGNEFVAEIPVVHRARQRRRAGAVRRIDVTWNDGRHGHYLPTDHLDVLEA